MISINKQKSCESLKKNIISATKLYVNENKYDLGFTCDNTIEIPISNTIKISISKLIEAGKIDGDIKNPINNDDLTNKEVSVTFNCQTKQFTYDFDYNCQ